MNHVAMTQSSNVLSLQTHAKHFRQSIKDAITALYECMGVEANMYFRITHFPIMTFFILLIGPNASSGRAQKSLTSLDILERNVKRR